jgi:RimJ/RimL family protein N-acetyltransferase
MPAQVAPPFVVAVLAGTRHNSVNKVRRKMQSGHRAGQDLSRWVPPAMPARQVIDGQTVVLEPLNADAHAADLHRAFGRHDALWDYMPYGPFTSAASYHRWAKEMAPAADPMFFVLRSRETGHCGGVASYLRITPAAGSIEVGHICISPELQRSRVATEAMYLMMKAAFEAGYRRYEWKCDARNKPSRRAAQRLGFSYEGTFRQATVVKGRNRDTAWFSVIDSEWPALSEAYLAWLSPKNFDAAGRQRERLSDLTGLVRGGEDLSLRP